MRRPCAPHLRRLAIETARRAMADKGDEWALEVYDGDPSDARALVRWWRYRVADPIFYPWFPEGLVLNGPGDHSKDMGVWIGAEVGPERPGFASRLMLAGYFAGTFPVADIALEVVPAQEQLTLVAS